MSKFKLSDTMQFLTGRLNAVRGGEVHLSLEMDADEVSAGEPIRAEAHVHSPGKHRVIDRLAVSLRGHVQRDGGWQEYVQTAEIAHDTALPADHEFVVPIVILIPADAVLSEDGATWSLSARAFLDKKFDPRAECRFSVIA